MEQSPETVTDESYLVQDERISQIDDVEFSSDVWTIKFNIMHLLEGIHEFMWRYGEATCEHDVARRLFRESKYHEEFAFEGKLIECGCNSSKERLAKILIELVDESTKLSENLEKLLNGDMLRKCDFDTQGMKAYVDPDDIPF